MKIYQTVKLLVFYGFLQVFVTSALVQSAGADESLPLFCPPDIDEVAYEAAADDTDEKVKIKACQWLRDDEQGREANARDAKAVDEGKLYFGVASSQLSPHQERGNWASARPLIYQVAYLDLAKEFVSQIHGQDISLTTEQEDYKQRGLDTKDLECYPGETESKWYDRVLRKSGAVLEKKLDKALVELKKFKSQFRSSDHA